MHLLLDALPAPARGAGVETTDPPHSVLICVAGNRDRGDDAAGPLVADHLRETLPPGVRVVDAATDPMTLMDDWDGAAVVFLVDATSAGAPPGTVHRFDGVPPDLPAEPPRASTHGLGLGTALRLADTLGRLPPRVVLYGIEGVCFDIGAAPSPAVLAATREVAARIRAEVATA